MARKLLFVLIMGFLGIVFLGCISLALQLELPDPTGSYMVGRTQMAWVDETRPEILTDTPQDKRNIVAVIWYPAQRAAEQKAPYISDFGRISAVLRDSGEVSPFETSGMAFIRSKSYLDAGLGGDGSPFPILLFSPGNGTNIEFYSSIAEELASHGYIVVGLNHPYDVPAAALADGSIAGYYKQQWDMEPSAHQGFSQERIDVRVADALYVLDRLVELNVEENGLLAGALDLNRVGFLGHSLGGITAAQSCVRDTRLRACLNLDGIQAGGAFSAHANPALPVQPFLFITKEEQLPPGMTAQFAALAGGGTVVVVHGASHDSFTDGPVLTPSILPIENQADRVLAMTRQYTLAFFDQALKDQPSALLSSPYENEQVSVQKYIQ